MINLLTLFQGGARTAPSDTQSQFVCSDQPRRRFWHCQSTLQNRHICAGHKNGRPDYMHTCGCGKRWAE